MPASSNPFHDATVSALLDGVAARYPDREALVLDDERLTFGEFRQRAETLARGLGALELSLGDKVAIWLPNRPSWFIAQQACARIPRAVRFVDDVPRTPGPHGDKVQKGTLRDQALRELGIVRT